MGMIQWSSKAQGHSDGSAYQDTTILYDKPNSTSSIKALDGHEMAISIIQTSEIASRNVNLTLRLDAPDTYGRA